MTPAMQARLFRLADQFGLTRQERHDLALIIVGHEGSWSRLSEEDAGRLVDVLHGYAYVQHLLRDRTAMIRAQIAAPAPAMPAAAARR